MEKTIHFNISYMNGGSFSDSTIFLVENKAELVEAIKDMRGGNGGIDTSDIEYISFWDNEGEEF